MKQYKKDVLYDLFPELNFNIELIEEILSDDKLSSLINKKALKLPQKARIIFCMLIECKNSRDKAYNLYRKNVNSEIKLESFQRSMTRAKEKLVDLLRNSKEFITLKNSHFKN